MESIIDAVQNKYRKKQVAAVRSGDTVRVSQRIKEGSKERVQVFEGLVIRTKRQNSLTSTITVRRIASGVGVEKTFMLHSPLVEKVEVVKRSKVRRKYLSYMRERGGKSARLDAVAFDKGAVNQADNSLRADEAADKKAATEEPVAESTTDASDTKPNDDDTESKSDTKSEDSVKADEAEADKKDVAAESDAKKD